MPEWILTKEQTPSQFGWYFVTQQQGEPKLMGLGRFGGSFMWNLPNAYTRYDLEWFDDWQPIERKPAWTLIKERAPDQLGWYFVLDEQGDPHLMILTKFGDDFMWNPPNTPLHQALERFKGWQRIEVPAAPGKKCEPVTTDRARIIEAINKERDRQDHNFRPMPHNMPPTGWLTVITEETGEVARAILEGDVAGYEKELIQVAATAVAAIEDLHKGDSSRSLEDTVSWKGRVNQWLQRLLIRAR
jgi:NTP pyrophosphatase (non-canonical NTP hydrolase)